MSLSLPCSPFFFFNDTATTEIYTLSLHDALPIFHCCRSRRCRSPRTSAIRSAVVCAEAASSARDRRSEEHTSELQSHSDLVCRLLLEKKKKHKKIVNITNKTPKKRTLPPIDRHAT